MNYTPAARGLILYLLGDCSVAVQINLSDAGRLSIRRLTIRRQLFILVMQHICRATAALSNQAADSLVKAALQ